MRNKKFSWDDVSLSKYEEIVKVFEDKDLEEMDKNVKVIAILEDKAEDEIWDMPIGELGKYDISFLNDFNYPKNIKFNKIKIGEWDLVVDNNLSNFSVAQYVDFNTYWSEKRKDLAKVISVFLIPKGKKYNTDYDLVKLVNDIKDNISLPMANGIAFFLLKRFMKSTHFSRVYLNLLTKRLMKKIGIKKRKEQVE